MTAYRMRVTYQGSPHPMPWEIVTPDDNGIITVVTGSQSFAVEIKEVNDPGKENQRMSIIRFGERSSDVYVYVRVVDMTLECCDCVMLDRCFITSSPEAMAQHLRDHRTRGDVVPVGVIENVLANPIPDRT